MSMKATNQPLESVLNQLFKGTNITYSLLDKHIVLSLQKENNTQQQRKPIKVVGNITDSKEEPLIGVNIVIKGTTSGVITDLNGHFELQATEGDILEVTYVGFDSQSIVVTNNQPIKIILIENAEVLDEVVVTALGIKRASKALI